MRGVAGILVVVLLCTLLPVATASGQPVDVIDGEPSTTERLGVEDPVGGAIMISQARFAADQADYVVLATTNDFADALAATPLLGAGPLLFTPPDMLPTEVSAEVDRVVPDGTEVIVLGGTVAINTSISEQLTNRGYDVTRLAGPDRIATSIQIVEELAARVDAGQVVALARAYGEGTAGWADSVTAGGWTADTGTPLLLTPTDSLDPRVADLLQRLQTDTTIVLGGSAAIADEVLTQLPSPQRIAGPDRTSTAVAIAEQLWGPVPGYLIVNGYRDDGWTYGLASAGLSADLGLPILLADTSAVPSPTLMRVGLGCGSGQPGLETLLVGSPTLLSDEVVAAIDTQDGGECPASPIQIRGDGLGLIPLGTPVDQAVATLTDALGQPTFVSEKLFPFCEPGAFGKGRIYEWNNLTTYMMDPTADPYTGNQGTGEPYFWGGLYGGFDYDPATNTFAPRPDPYGFTTELGIGIGATGAEVQAAYGASAEFFPGDLEGYPPPIWDLGNGLYTFNDTNDIQTTRIETFLFGGGCGE